MNKVSDGSFSVGFKTPKFWDLSKDIKINIAYAIDQVDDGKIIKLQTKVWAITTSPFVIGTPNATGVDNVVLSSGALNTRFSVLLTNGKLSAPLTQDAYVIVQVTRQASLDDYPGIISIMDVEFYQ